MRLLNKTRNIPHRASKEVWGNVLPQMECFSVLAQKLANDVITVYIYFFKITCLVTIQYKEDFESLWKYMQKEVSK